MIQIFLLHFHGGVCARASALLENSQNLTVTSIVPNERLIYALSTLRAQLYFAISLGVFDSKVAFCVMVCYALPNF